MDSLKTDVETDQNDHHGEHAEEPYVAATIPNEAGNRPPTVLEVLNRTKSEPTD
jgi:hypothetical protein